MALVRSSVSSSGDFRTPSPWSCCKETSARATPSALNGAATSSGSSGSSGERGSRRWSVRRGTPSPSDLTGMEAALRLARAASVREEVPVGAVVVADGDVLAEAHNETVHRRGPTPHAPEAPPPLGPQEAGGGRVAVAPVVAAAQAPR